MKILVPVSWDFGINSYLAETFSQRERGLKNLFVIHLNAIPLRRMFNKRGSMYRRIKLLTNRAD